MQITVTFESLAEVDDFCSKFGGGVNPPTQMAQINTEQGGQKRGRKPKTTESSPAVVDSSTSEVVDATTETSTVASTITDDELKAAALAKANEGVEVRDKVVALVAKYTNGTKMVPDIAADKRADFLAELSAIAA